MCEDLVGEPHAFGHAHAVDGDGCLGQHGLSDQGHGGLLPGTDGHLGYDAPVQIRAQRLIGEVLLP